MVDLYKDVIIIVVRYLFHCIKKYNIQMSNTNPDVKLQELQKTSQTEKFVGSEIKTGKYTTQYRNRELFRSDIKPDRSKNEQSQTLTTSRFSEQRYQNLINQLETFYLPFMNQIFNQHKSKLEGKIYSPQQILRRIKGMQVDSQQKRTLEFLKRQNDYKESKIKDLVMKNSNLIAKLKKFMPEEQINSNNNVSLAAISNPTGDDNERKIKRLQNLLLIKNEEMFFRTKVQATNLLQEFQIDKNESAGIKQLDNESAIFQFIISKLKTKFKDFRSKQRQSTQQIQRERVLQERKQETIHFLTQTNEILKVSELRAKQKLDDILSQLHNLYEKLTSKEKQIQEKDNQIFRLKKLQEESNNQLLKINSNEWRWQTQLQQQKREYDNTIKQLRALLTSYNLQKKTLTTIIQEKDYEIEQILIRQKYFQQQYEKASRQYTRWKQRYEWLQNQKQAKIKSYQEDITILRNQFANYKTFFNPIDQDLLKAEIQKLNMEISGLKQKIRQYQQQLNYNHEHHMELQQSYYKKVQELETEYLAKNDKFQQMKKIQMNELMATVKQAEQEKLQQKDRNIALRLQEIEIQTKNKLSEVQRQYSEIILRLNNQNQLLNEQITELKIKIQQKDKLITILYPMKIQIGEEEYKI